MKCTNKNASYKSFCWGNGNFEQHGHGVKHAICFSESLLSPLKSPMGSFFVNVSCGASHTIALSENFEVYTWGNGYYGQLGQGKDECHCVPTRIWFDFETFHEKESQEFIVEIACGDRHSCFVSNTGHLYFCGCNLSPSRTNGLKDHEYQEMLAIPKLISCHQVIEKVSCGQHHTLLLTSDGKIGAFGRNNYGQIGLDSCEYSEKPLFLTNFTVHISSVAAGSNHSLALDEQGRIFIWGYGRACGLQRGHIYQPMPLSNFKDESMGSTMTNDNSLCNKCPEIKWKMIAGGASHSLFLSENGAVFGLGDNKWGQLTEERSYFYSEARAISGDYFDSHAARIDCGEDYSCAITERGSVYMWGKNCFVIDDSKDISHKFCEPVRILDGLTFEKERVVGVSCGTWHAALVVDCRSSHSEHRSFDRNEVSRGSKEDCETNNVVPIRSRNGGLPNCKQSRLKSSELMSYDDDYNSLSVGILIGPQNEDYNQMIPLQDLKSIKDKKKSCQDSADLHKEDAPERLSSSAMSFNTKKEDSSVLNNEIHKSTVSASPEYERIEHIANNYSPSMIHNSKSLRTEYVEENCSTRHFNNLTEDFITNSSIESSKPSSVDKQRKLSMPTCDKRQQKLSATIPSVLSPIFPTISPVGRYYFNNLQHKEAFASQSPPEAKQLSQRCLKVSPKQSNQNQYKMSGELTVKPPSVQNIEFPRSTVMDDEIRRRRGSFVSKRFPKLITVTIRKHIN